MTQEHEKYLQQAEAEVLSQKGIAELLLASSKREMAYLYKLREAYERIDKLQQDKSITINNTYNAPVTNAIGSVEQLSESCQPSPSQTTSTPRLDSTLTTLTK